MYRPFTKTTDNRKPNNEAGPFSSGQGVNSKVQSNEVTVKATSENGRKRQ